MTGCPRCGKGSEVLYEEEPDVGIMIPLYHCLDCRIQFFWDYYHDELHVLEEPNDQKANSG